MKKSIPMGVVVADDNPNDRQLFSLAIQYARSQMTVTFVADAAEAIAHLLGSGLEPPRAPLPRLVILDLFLPDASGLDVLKRLRDHDRTKHLPIVVFSASDSERDRAAALELGADDYVLKPAGFENLCATLTELERAWLGSPDASSA